MDRSKAGTKRSLLVEGGGVPVALSVAGANRNDFKLLEETLQSIPIEPPAAEEYLRHLCLDKGYDYEEVRHILHAYGLVAHIRSRGEEARGQEEKEAWREGPPLGGRTPPIPGSTASAASSRAGARRPRTTWGMLYFVCGMISYRAAGLFG